MGRFGRWKIDGLDEKKSERKKRHWWNVTCTCPRRTKKSVPARALLEGKSRSCGCIEHRFNSSVVNRKRAEKAKQFVDGIEYWTPRIVMEFLDIDWTTLDELWSATKPRVNSEGRRKRPGCPHLPNRRPIGTRKLREGYNLEVRHFVADDCRLARKVLDQKIGIPTPSHATRLEEALIELGYSKGTLYRRLRRVGACVENISGHRKGGRPQEYVFVPNSFIKREKPQWEPARLSTGAESVNGIEALHAKIDEHSEKLNGMHAVATETNAKLDGVKAAVDSVPVAVAESNARLGAKLDEHHAAVGAKLDKLKARPTDDEDKNHRERIQSLNVDVLWDQHVIVGASGEARFDRGDVQWPIVNSAIKALPGQFTWDTVLAVYPGVESKDARQAAITRINEKLVNVSLRIEKRKIIRI